MFWWCFCSVLVMCLLCFVILVMFWWRVGNDLMILRDVLVVFKLFFRDVPVMFWWCFGACQVILNRCVGDVCMMLGWYLDDALFMCWWCFERLYDVFSEVSRQLFLNCAYMVRFCMLILMAIFILRSMVYLASYCHCFIFSKYWGPASLTSDNIINLRRNIVAISLKPRTLRDTK